MTYTPPDPTVMPLVRISKRIVEQGARAAYHRMMDSINLGHDFPWETLAGDHPAKTAETETAQTVLETCGPALVAEALILARRRLINTTDPTLTGAQVKQQMIDYFDQAITHTRAPLNAIPDPDIMWEWEAVENLTVGDVIRFDQTGPVWDTIQWQATIVAPTSRTGGLTDMPQTVYVDSDPDGIGYFIAADHARVLRAVRPITQT